MDSLIIYEPCYTGCYQIGQFSIRNYAILTHLELLETRELHSPVVRI